MALTVVSRARRRDAYARELLRVAPEMTRLSLKSRGLASRLVLGTCACVGQLDDVLDRYVAKPKGLQPRVRDALRLACFELLHLDTATQVAVSQGVELVRRGGYMDVTAGRGCAPRRTQWKPAWPMGKS